MLFLTAIRKKLASIKKELKCWESMYMRGHGRKPTKVRKRYLYVKIINVPYGDYPMDIINQMFL